MENILLSPQKVKEIPNGPKTPLLGILIKESKTGLKYIHVHTVYNSTTYNSQKVKTM